MGGSSNDNSSTSSTSVAASTGTAIGSVDRTGTATTTTATSGSATTGTAAAAATTIGSTAAVATTTGTTAAATTTSNNTISGTTTASTGTRSGSTSSSGGSSTASSTSSGSKKASTTPTNTKSISSYVSCTGTSDDTSGAIKAFAAARHNAFTLVVDCPVRLHSGLAVDRGIFIDTGTTVQFTGSGKFHVDNMFHPAFIIASSSNITLQNWVVEWDGSVGVNSNMGGYEINGRFVPSGGATQPAGAFNDLVLTPWLASNRSINFIETQGWVKSIWVGGVNPAAVFFLTGDTSNVVFSGLKLSVPASAGGDKFMPMAFSSSANWRSNQTVTGKTPFTGQYAVLPHGITFSGIDLDGTLFGWQGNIQDSMFENITSHRYGDLQDANGNNVGGIGKWFPPPHLFYLNTRNSDPELQNTNIHISNVLDEGPRIGVARDKGGSDTQSGYAPSLKLGCSDCTVDNYTSKRPDGFMDVLPSESLTVSNVTASFDSQFINNVYPAGIRYPAQGYSHVTFENISLTDTADSTVRGPIGNATAPGNEDLVYSNFKLVMNRWSGPEQLPLPTYAGTNTNIAIDFAMTGQSMKVSYLVKGSMAVNLKGFPTALNAGSTTTLAWNAKEASSCGASGAWDGALSNSGSKAVKLSNKGNLDFTFTCHGSSGASGSTTLTVTVQ